jgi:TonB family protein
MIPTSRESSRYLLGLGMAFLLTFGTAFGTAATAEAPDTEQEAEVAPYEGPIGEDWPERLEQIDEDLQAGRWGQASEAVEEIAQEMVDALAIQPGADSALGTVATYRALAAAGQGQRHEALWRWAMAQNLYTPYRQADLTLYGEAGALLAQNRLREIGDTYRGDLHRMADVSEGPSLAEAQPPAYPATAQGMGEAGPVLVEVVVGPDGRLKDPLVLESPGSPPLIYAALEAMGDWRFEPAQADGEPVAVMRTLRVVFELQDPED